MKIAPAIFLSLAASFQMAWAQSSASVVNCAVKPFRVIELSSIIPGVVAEVFVEPGDEVAEGDVILRLDDELAKSDLLIAETRASQTATVAASEAQVDASKRKLERVQNAYDKNAVSLSELEEVQLELELAQITLERNIQELSVLESEAQRARLFVERSRVVSPVTGVIGEDLASVGEAVSSETIGTLTVTNPKRAEAFVPIGLLEKVKNQSIKFRVNGMELDRNRIELDYVSPTANLSSNTISVFFNIAEESVLPGHTCLIEVIS